MVAWKPRECSILKRISPPTKPVVAAKRLIAKRWGALC